MMRRRFSLGVVLLLCGLVCFIDMAPADPPAPGAGCCEGAKKGKKKTGTKDKCASTKCCPLYVWANWGTYCSYYAMVCTSPPDYVNLDATNCTLPTIPCQGDCSKCVDVGTYKTWKGAKRASGHQHQPGLEGGVEKKPPIKKDKVVPDASKGFAKIVGEPILIYLQTKAAQAPADYAKVMLYTVSVRPKDDGKPYPPRFFGTGVEVDTTDTPEFTILFKDLVRPPQGKVYTVLAGSVTHQVILAK